MIPRLNLASSQASNLNTSTPMGQVPTLLWPPARRSHLWEAPRPTPPGQPLTGLGSSPVGEAEHPGQNSPL